MNNALADFLLRLLRDPEALRSFNTEGGRDEILRNASTLTEADRAALMSGDSSDILTRLHVEPGEEDQLTFVVGPGIKPPLPSALIGWGIKGPSPEPGPLRAPARLRKGGTTRTANVARKGTKTSSRKSKGAARKKSRR